MRFTVLASAALLVCLAACRPAGGNEEHPAALTFTLAPLDSVRLDEGVDAPIVVTSALEVTDSAFYILDAPARDVKVFTRTGEPVRVIGRPGPGPGEFRFPVGMAIEGTQLYVADDAQLRVSVFTAVGEFVRSIPLPPGTYTDLAVLDDGTLALAGRLPTRDTQPTRVPTMHFISRDGTYQGSSARREPPTHPYERAAAGIFLARSGDRLCSATRTSNVGVEYDRATGRVTYDTLAAGRYRPVEWLTSAPPGGDTKQFIDWWKSQTRTLFVVGVPDGACLVEFYDPLASPHHYVTLLERDRRTATIDGVDAQLETALADTVFGVARGDDGTITVIRYLLKTHEPRSRG
jgi:hypothetical protein